MRFIDLARFLAEANADKSYTIIGRNFTSSKNNGVLIYHLLIISICLHIPHAYAFVTKTKHFLFLSSFFFHIYSTLYSKFES